MAAGVGGWVCEPWRDNGYPADSPQARKLECASRALRAIKINSTDSDDHNLFAELPAAPTTPAQGAALQRNVFMIFISCPNVKAGGDGVAVAPAPRACARDTCELPGTTLSRRLKTLPIAFS